MHIIPRGKRWIVRKPGSERALRRMDSYEQAEAFALSKLQTGEFVYRFGKDGRIASRKAA